MDKEGAGRRRNAQACSDTWRRMRVILRGRGPAPTLAGSVLSGTPSSKETSLRASRESKRGIIAFVLLRKRSFHFDWSFEPSNLSKLNLIPLF